MWVSEGRKGPGQLVGLGHPSSPWALLPLPDQACRHHLSWPGGAVVPVPASLSCILSFRWGQVRWPGGPVWLLCSHRACRAPVLQLAWQPCQVSELEAGQQQAALYPACGP